MNLPKRKPTRLKDFDYSTEGYYFITICTHNKQKFLCDIVGEGLCALPKIKLTHIGKIVYESIEYMEQNNKNIFIDKFVIMPNHIHLIIENQTGGHGDPPLQIYDVIGNFKSFTTHKYGDTLWQRSFHDHVIRGDADYLKIWEYIDTNPKKWKEDCFYTE